MRAVDVVIGVGWVAFWVYWLVAAAGSKPGRTRWRQFAGIRIVAVLAVLLLLRVHTFGNDAATKDPWLAGIGFILFLAGLLLAIWARVHLGRNWGMPMSEKSDAELVTIGPYRMIRHPIYTGFILAMTGTALAVSPYWLIVTAAIGGYFVYAAFMEERRMTEQFPDAYRPYQKRTKMLIPFIF